MPTKVLSTAQQTSLAHSQASSRIRPLAQALANPIVAANLPQVPTQVQLSVPCSEVMSASL